MKVISILLLFVLIILNSCAPAYIPNVVNTPLLSNKGEFQAAVNTGLAGFDPQLSYAITDHVGIMLNGSFADRASDTTDDFHKHQFIEIGSGYYRKLGTSGRVEAFGGFGVGQLQAEYNNDYWKPYTTVKNYRIFIQPAIGAATDYFDGSFASRLVMIDMYQGTSNNTGFFVEPVLTAKLGYKYVKLMGQLGLSIPLNASQVDFMYQPILFSIGLQVDIGRHYED